jgi:hypothetical protein
MRRFAVLIGLVLLFTGVTAQAGDRVGIGVKAGTYGLGVDLTGRVNDWFSIRGSFSQYDLSRTVTESDIDYDGTLKAGGYGVLFDFFPAKGNFRLSAGLFKNRNKFFLTGTPTTSIDIGNGTYTPAQVGTLDGDVIFKTTAPYFGLGYGSAARASGRVRFLLDVGVIAQGAGQATLTASGGQVSAADLQAEEAQIEDNIKNYKLWPVVAFGISFRL